ncbi:hypothetical protein II5_05919 [Bacillus cereus MSX-A1]|uniref:hypothetical protein n=1 Tax=Bacillus cereus TaxID=1396 RepID=UPI00027978E9|nr:hypothetical protein [Bacillus cereus]EJQ97840.1 hypothetical protein II5_05919 [Bacillus cereus MSX-A1]
MIEEEFYEPYNVLTQQSNGIVDENLIRSWHRWEMESADTRIPAVAGIIGTYLVKELANYAGKKLLQSLYGLLFPNNSTSQIEAILEATEEMVDRKLTELVRDLV